jgi:hypothetical protein
VPPVAWPVTPEVAGSSLVAPVSKSTCKTASSVAWTDRVSCVRRRRLLPGRISSVAHQGELPANEVFPAQESPMLLRPAPENRSYVRNLYRIWPWGAEMRPGVAGREDGAEVASAAPVRWRWPLLVSALYVVVSRLLELIVLLASVTGQRSSRFSCCGTSCRFFAGRLVGRGSSRMIGCCLPR